MNGIPMYTMFQEQHHALKIQMHITGHTMKNSFSWKGHCECGWTSGELWKTRKKVIKEYWGHKAKAR